MNGAKIPLVQWGVDTGRYNTRPISSAFPGASEELKCLVLNLRLHPVLAVPMSKGYFSGSGTSYYAAKRALDSLREDGWVELAANYGADIGRARVWREEDWQVRVGVQDEGGEEAAGQGRTAFQANCVGAHLP